MLYNDTMSNVRPEKITIETFQERSPIIILTNNIKMELDESGSEMFTYDMVTFDLPYDRNENVETISNNFDAWWAYGSQEEKELTLEERVSQLEDIIIELIGGEM